MTGMPDATPAEQPVRFAPIPLVSGTTVKDQPVAGVTVTITATDGSTVVVPLEARNGGWWVPADRLHG